MLKSLRGSVIPLYWINKFMNMKRLLEGVLGGCALALVGARALAADYYVDYSSGADSNPGTLASPWKHCPGDPAATGSAGGTTFAAGLASQYLWTAAAFRFICASLRTQP